MGKAAGTVSFKLRINCMNNEINLLNIFFTWKIVGHTSAISKKKFSKTL